MILALAKIIATGGGIGYIKKGSGTVAAFALCVVWYFSYRDHAPNHWLTAGITIGIFALGVWSATAVEKIWEKDSSKIVIDEIGGMCVSLILVPVCVPYLLIGFASFRILDITKPLFIRRSETLPAGWGVMADDLLAGIFTNLILQIVARFNLC
ncbi:MAG TPA: phosphatidylglycerophosphatase A [Puia sp.]|nr:phosphatidylglycerophosphatase A [Puia sp.]